MTDGELPPRVLREIVERTPHPLWLIDQGGAIAFANPAAVGLLGYPSTADLLGRPSHATLHHSHADGSPYLAAECPVLRTLHGEACAGLEWFFRRDGRPFLARWSTDLLGDGPAAVVLLSFSGVDHRPPPVRDRTISSLESRLADRFRDPGFTPAALARESHLSLRRVQLAYARSGSSPAARLRDLRLAHAADLLAHGRSPRDAWEASGFLDGGTFTRAFKRKYGVTPSAFRGFGAVSPDR